MSIPITGILLIPLGLLISFLPWRYCLAGLMVFAMMSPAAVVNYGNFGLQPGYYLAILLIGRTALGIMRQRFRLNAFVLSHMQALFWFTAVVFAVLFIALCFFQGSVETLPGTYGFKSGLTHPFHLARENFTQIVYLILNICLVYALAHTGAREGFKKSLSAWDIAFACGLAFAVVICVWQFVSLYAGIPFPADFFYSNAGYSRADSQSMVGLFRINGPFEEPSTLGYTFTGYLMYAWARYGKHPTILTILMILSCIFCMVVSTSTTAFLGLFLFASVVLFDVSTRRAPLRLVLTVFGLVGFMAGAILIVADWQALHIILQNTLFDKTQSTSFQQRSFADFLALQIFSQTYGIGVGLGSHKANSLVLTLLSNTGILGLVLFCSFIYGLLRWKPRVFGGRSVAKLSSSVRPFQLGLLGLLLIHIVSNPNLSVLTLWLSMGALLALQTAERAELSSANVDTTSPRTVSGPGAIAQSAAV